MIIRIVRMTFKPEEVDSFLELFEGSKSQIRHFEGCMHLELLKDASHPCIFSTYSKWKNEESLNAYRKSSLFGKVWPATKTKFAEKPVAFSLTEFIHVE